MSELTCSAICRATAFRTGELFQEDVARQSEEAEIQSTSENKLAACGLGVRCAAGDGGRPLFMSAFYRYMAVGRQSKVSDFSR